MGTVTWIAIGIGAWFVVSVPVALVVGRLLRRSAESCPSPCQCILDGRDVADVPGDPAAPDAAGDPAVSADLADPADPADTADTADPADPDVPDLADVRIPAPRVPAPVRDADEDAPACSPQPSAMRAADRD